MGKRQELEAALISGLDRHTLAVYADYLQSIDDPRGELIALDLEIEERGSTAEMAARRTSLLHAWLGALVPADNVHRSWVGDSLRFGFIDDLELDHHDPNARARLDAILASDAGRFVRGITLRGRAPDLEAALQRLAATRHAWLTRLTIECHSLVPRIAETTTAAVIAAFPQLELLEVAGSDVFAAFPHPTLRRLTITGSRAVACLYDAAAGPPFVAVTDLDLAFGLERVQPDTYAYDQDQYAGPEREDQIEVPRLSAAQLPALRRLDLSRNDRSTSDQPAFDDYEPYDDEQAVPPVSPLAFLAGLELRAQLTHLRLPSLRSVDDMRELDVALRTMVALVEVEVVHGHYFEIPDLAHPTATFVRPPPWPWPRPTSLDTETTISVAVPGTSAGDPVALVDAIRELERRFEALPAPARTAWTQLWQTITTLGAGERPFPVDALLVALDACRIETGGWRQLNDELRSRRPFPPGAVVRLAR